MKFSDYCIQTIYFKPYASCRHCHPSIDAVLELKRTHNFDNSQIVKIDIYTYSNAIKGHDHCLVHGSSSAKLSIPYSVAVALFENKADIDNFLPPYINNSEILELAKKVSVFEDAEISKNAHIKRASITKISLVNDTVLTKRIDYPRGEPENPIDIAEIESKFRSLATFGGKKENEIDEIISYVNSI
jgi:2-methylcitrate dehydratase PrpD